MIEALWYKLDDGILREARRRLGARWCVAILLSLPCLFGIYRFGPKAALLLLTSILSCVLANNISRRLAEEPTKFFNPSTLITGMLIGLTLQESTPIYAVIAGGLVAEIPGKWILKNLGRNLINPAILGRSFIAILEWADPIVKESSRGVDLISGASVLFKDEGAIYRPKMVEAFLGFTDGAIGETSAIILLVCGVLLLRYVVIKKEAAVTMILSVPLWVIVLPTPIETLGHAPWVENPLLYLLGGSTLLCAFFFATDPVTTPRTRGGGIVFGSLAGLLGVLGRKYTQVPGCEMFGILLMNLLTPALDRYLPVLTHIPNRIIAQALSKVFLALPTPETSPAIPEREIQPVTLLDSSALEATGSFYHERPQGTDKEWLHFSSGSCPLLEDHSKNRAYGLLKHRSENLKGMVFQNLRKSGLKGRGGAQFPVWKKWEALLSNPGPRYLVVNAQEGERSTFKDRYLMKNHPEVAAEGILLTALAMGAKKVYVVIPPGFDEERACLSSALNQARSLVSEKPQLEILEGSGLYICGEESALLNFLESHRGEPRKRPPYPVEKGLYNRPTLVHNLETLSWIPLLVHDLKSWKGATHTGRMLVSLSGTVNSPGVYECQPGASINSVIAAGKGMLNGQTLKGFQVGGGSGAFLPASLVNTKLDLGSLKQAAAFLGTAALRIYTQPCCMVCEALKSISFMAEESCGHCTPCRLGTENLAHLWKKLGQGKGSREEFSTIQELIQVVSHSSACGLGRTSATALQSIINYWPDEIELHLEGQNKRQCRLGQN
jgi:NADH:ubiquinone oxidoreductase subunit F (NADH-binding)/Na+-translocating ferredoxin:NAD+ oxidoreductase RnfD subunit